MPRPTARVLVLLEILQSGGTRTQGELAERLGVDERTVRRYIDQLRELDIPVRSVRGRHGGYRLAPGYRMPPLMLGDDEALAVLVGLLVGRRAGLISATMAAEGAAAKVRRVLPEKLGRRLDALLRAAEFTAPARTGEPTGTDVLLELAEAAGAHRPVAITYRSRDGRPSERTLSPYGLVAHSGRWYAVGADSASGQVRSFRIDRIATAQTQPGTFDAPANFDAAARLLSGLADAPWTHRVSVRVTGKAAEIAPRLPAGLATVAQLDDDVVRVELQAERLDWVPALLASLDRDFVVEEPDELRDLVHALANRLVAAAKPPSDHDLDTTRRTGMRS
jgi:predicted DNA-binding transcriptional regulator YafY